MAEFDPSMLLQLMKPQSDGPDQSMVADALRQKEQLGMLAQLSGNQTAAPFAQSVLKGVEDDRAQQVAAQQRAGQQRITLAQAYQNALDKQNDNQRQDKAQAETEQHHRYIEQHPAPIFQFGQLPGAAPDAAPTGALINPNTGKVTPTGLSKPPTAGAEGGQAKLKDKLIADLGKDLDPTTGRSNLATSQQKQLEAAERIETLLNAPGPFNTERLGEAITMAATIANGGATPTESQRAMLLPHTARGNLSKYLEFVTNSPQDAGAQEFINQIRQQSEREKATAGAQMRRTMLGRLVKHQEAFQKYPEEAARLAEAAKLKGAYDPKTLLPTETIDPVAEASAGDKKAKLVSRIGVLKAQGLDATAIKAKLREEGF